MTERSRVAAGTPTGGQFAAHSRADSDVTLGGGDLSTLAAGESLTIPRRDLPRGAIDAVTIRRDAHGELHADASFHVSLRDGAAHAGFHTWPAMADHWTEDEFDRTTAAVGARFPGARLEHRPGGDELEAVVIVSVPIPAARNVTEAILDASATHAVRRIAETFDVGYHRNNTFWPAVNAQKRNHEPAAAH